MLCGDPRGFSRVNAGGWILDLGKYLHVDTPLEGGNLGKEAYTE